MRLWEVAWAFGDLGLNPVVISTMAAFALVAGFIGWRRATKPIYRRTYADVDVPEGMTRREYDRGIRRQRKRWRLYMTLSFASTLCSRFVLP